MSDISVIGWYQSIHCVFCESLCDDCVTCSVDYMHDRLYIENEEQ